MSLSLSLYIYIYRPGLAADGHLRRGHHAQRAAVRQDGQQPLGLLCCLLALLLLVLLLL